MHECTCRPAGGPSVCARCVLRRKEVCLPPVWAVLCPACCEMETDMFRCEMPSSSSSVGTLGPPCFQKVCTGSREEAGLGVGSHTCCLCFLPPEMRAGREVQPYSAAARRFPVASSATMDCVPLNKPQAKINPPASCSQNRMERPFLWSVLPLPTPQWEPGTPRPSLSLWRNDTIMS